jgi:hypothetical protein
MTENDWLQIKMAAKGYYSGYLSEWPNLHAALVKRGRSLPLDSTGYTVIPVCKTLIKQRKV